MGTKKGQRRKTARPAYVRVYRNRRTIAKRAKTAASTAKKAVRAYRRATGARKARK